MTRSTVESLTAELRDLEAANEAAPGWGAAVGARLERIKEIKRALVTSDPDATARPWEVPADLVECCQELLDWSRTGLLAEGKDGAVRARAEAFDRLIDDYHHLRAAEDSVQMDAVRFVVQAGQAVNDRDALLAQVEVIPQLLTELRRCMALIQGEVPASAIAVLAKATGAA